MEESWEDWHLHSELDCVDDYLTDNCVNNNDDGEEFLREILQLQTPLQAFSSESESDYSLQIQNNPVSATNDVVLPSLGMDQQDQGNLVKSNSSNIVSQQSQQRQQGCKNNSKTTRRSCSPKTYILSFDNSTMITATTTPELEPKRDSRFKRSRGEIQNVEPKKSTVKKARSSSQTSDHIMAERKRRQELTERFIALSATIPGLSKTDKASILRAAIDYVKQLQERVQELERQQDKKDVAPVIVINKKSHVFGNNEETISCETNCDDDEDDSDVNILPEVDARVMGKEVLFEIICEKKNGIELKLLNHLENLQIFVMGSSVLPFGNSALSITIIAQMGEECKMNVNDLVKNLKQVLLQSDPY